jgi:outer membrane receptor protein involved in Fe transport
MIPYRKWIQRSAQVVGGMSSERGGFSSMTGSSTKIGRRRLAGPQSSMLALLALGAAPALAQTADQNAQVPQTETIQVTGTRIRNTDAQAANPVTVVSSEDIAKEKATDVEDVLKKLPSIDFSGGLSANSNNGGAGASAIGLRNLQPARTLVLVNGYRFPNTDNQAAVTAVDLNSIPVEMVDHIEVLRDGAASIYGADAIAGVVNIITKQHFNGVEIHGDVGETSYSDGLSYGAGSMMGSDFDRGNILIDIETHHRDPISQGARSWSTDQFIGTSGECANCSTKMPFLTGVIGTSGPTLAFLGSNNVVPLNSPSLKGYPGLVFSPANGRESDIAGTAQSRAAVLDDHDRHLSGAGDPGTAARRHAEPAEPLWQGHHQRQFPPLRRR